MHSTINTYRAQYYGMNPRSRRLQMSLDPSEPLSLASHVELKENLLALPQMQGVFEVEPDLAAVQEALSRFGEPSFETRAREEACLVLMPANPERTLMGSEYDCFEGVGPSVELASLVCLLRLQERVEAEKELGQRQIESFLAEML